MAYIMYYADRGRGALLVVFLVAFLFGVFKLRDNMRDSNRQLESAKTAAEAAALAKTTFLAIINDILDFSKIDAGRMELERQPFEPHGCIEDALDLVAAQADAKGLNLSYRVEPSVPPTIVSDGARRLAAARGPVRRRRHRHRHSCRSPRHVVRLVQPGVDASTTRKYGKGTRVSFVIQASAAPALASPVPSPDRHLAAELHKRLGSATPPLILLSSLSRPELGAPDTFAAALTKPVRSSRLYNAVSESTGATTHARAAGV